LFFWEKNIMKIGKVSENILKRSVFRQINTKRSEVLLGAGIGEDCAVIQLAEDEVFVISTDPITGTAQDIGHLAVHVTLNDLASSGAEPIGLMLTILLPEGTKEAELRLMIRQIEEVCVATNVEIIGGHTEVTKAVSQPVISVCGVGKSKAGRLITTAGAKPGQDIVVTKWVGLEGSSIIAKEKEQTLSERFSLDFIHGIQAFDAYLSVLPESRIAMTVPGDVAMHDVTEGGIWGALWEMAEASQVGLEIDLKKIPIRQETIEVCEFFNINPYQLISSGCMLIATDKGHELVSQLEREGINAAVVGKAMFGKDRILLNDGEKRYLEPPSTDELFKVI
jgi:hydrogenase maturation factor